VEVVSGGVASNTTVSRGGAEILFSKKGPLSYNGNILGGTLTVTDGVHTANIALLGQYTASEFAVSNDRHGGTLITFQATTPDSTVTGGGKGHG
jgi:hypothetical protein